MKKLSLSFIILCLSTLIHFSHAQISVLGTPDGIAGEFATMLTLPGYEVPIGTDRLLLVTVSSDLTPVSVTYGGNPMTPQGGGVNLWALTLGSNMVSSNFGDIVLVVDASGGSPAAFLGINAISFSGVDQDNPFENYQELPILPFSTSATLTIQSNIDDLVYDAIVIGCLDVSQGGACSVPPDATPDVGQTIQNDLAFNGSIFNGRGSTSTSAGALSVPVFWGFSGETIQPEPGIHLGGSIRKSPPPPNVGINTDNPERDLHITDVLRLEPRASEPSNPKKGDIYFSSTTNKLRVYDGTQWQDCW
ncbi:MAG: hypothetical protein HKN68_10945 [Saprospiraceae bacterium]|nr:hypothetical protein [Saprospiraceae bacterium]